MEIYNKIVNGNVQSLGKMPEQWRKVAERCLVVDPTQRAKDAAELFHIIKGDDDATEVGGPSTSSGTATGRGTRGGASSSDPSTPSPSESGAGGSKNAPSTAGGSKPAPTDKPKNKALPWLIAIGTVAVVALIVILARGGKPQSTDPDTQAYEACQTVADYRAYMRDYGRNALHYNEAKQQVDAFVADSTAKAQQLAAQLQAQQQAEAEAQAQADAEKKEEAAYKKCTTVAGCESYLKAYPRGKYADEVKAKKAELEAKEQQEAEKQEDEAYRKCTTIAACESYLKTYPKGRYVSEVRTKKTKLEQEQQAQQAQQGGNGSAGGHDYVDLGLPSGTLWAACNLGASKSEGYGNYYAWGETKPQSNNAYSWSSYKYANGTSWDDPKLTKYCSQSKYGNDGFTDNLTALQTGDDPAAANWGSGWRTPSKAQWDELLANTTNQWTTRNGVKGREFTSKKNGQKVFLPAGGRWDSELYYAGSLGYYWSRSLNTGGPYDAWDLRFHSDYCYMYYNSRRNGFTVRPVRQN